MVRRKSYLTEYVLDTSAVTDPRLREVLGVGNNNEVIKALSIFLRTLRTRAGVIFYTTPIVLNEMRRYLVSNNVEIEVFNEFSSWFVVKSPDKFSVKIPAAIISEYIEELRKRVYKGLRVAEDAVKKASKGADLGTVIHELREKYREALRKGIVDSPEDLDAIILSYELKSVLVTNDEGMRRMAMSLGIITIDPVNFIHSMRRFLQELQMVGGPTNRARSKGS